MQAFWQLAYITYADPEWRYKFGLDRDVKVATLQIAEKQKITWQI